MARVLEESGLVVTLPDETSFRIGECLAYQQICGRQLSEMDIGWWDEGRQVMCLLELKDYSKRSPEKELLPSLVAKGRDCLVIIHAIWRDLSDIARGIGSVLPYACRKPQKLRLFFVLKVGPLGLSKGDLSPLKDRLENQIKAYAQLLGIPSLVVLLLDHEKAIEKGLPLALAHGA